MTRQYSFPDGHWDWPVKLTHHHAVRAGNLIFTGGQVDLDANGTVRNIGDLDAQCRNSMRYMGALFSDLGVAFSDLVRLVVYYVGDANDEARLLEILARIIGPDVRPVVNMINMPELCYPGMLTEIEGVAMRAPDGTKIPKQHLYLEDMPHLPRTFSHVVRSGDMVFTSDMSALSSHIDVTDPDDVAAQTLTTMDRLCRALSAAGADIADVEKINCFYLGDGSALDWEMSAKIRAGYFTTDGPVATEIPLQTFPHLGLTTKIFATAICASNTDSRPADNCDAELDDDWKWPVSMPYKHATRSAKVIHVGGQVSLDSSAAAIHPDDMVAQTRVAMDNLKRALAKLGATLDDVVKVTTFYQGSASAAALHENLVIRSNSYTTPGPATTGIPVPSLFCDNIVIEIEAIAILD